MPNHHRRSKAIAISALLSLSAYTGLGQASVVTFKIDSLSTSNANYVEVEDIGFSDDKGGIAANTDRFYATGDGGTMNVDANTLSGAATSSHDALFTNINGGQLYSFSTNGSSAFSLPGGPNPAPGFTFTSIITLDPITMTAGPAITLSSAITFGNAKMNGVFAGYDNVILFENTSGATGNGNVTGNAHKIDLATGNVTTTSGVTMNAKTAENWAFYGVAEYFGGQDYLAHVTGVNPTNEIVRTNISNNLTETIATFSNNPGLGDLHEFTVVPDTNRWYFHTEANATDFGPAIASGNELIGYADMVMTIETTGGSGGASVPVPGSLAIFGIGLTGLIARRRRNAVADAA
ncbi:MAG: PEP-CTERM sorting domain-containing protein [Gammaproteobacteria bacterium]|nr:PEP-CTERM sorting domain-containing protein [Gammaproteobacteria bacterium]MCP5136481.1 PEP-CTERM sorting domain-containing protein [Gammaproteobacteria bacterium]